MLGIFRAITIPRSCGSTDEFIALSYRSEAPDRYEKSISDFNRPTLALPLALSMAFGVISIFKYLLPF